MPSFKLFPLAAVSGRANDTRLSARIKRHDGKFYDKDTKRFYDNSYFGDYSGSGSMNSPLIPLNPGTGLDQWWVTADVEINPAEFTDGNYIAFYHDGAYQPPRLFGTDDVMVFNGDPYTQKVPSTTDIALRIAQIKTGDTTFRDALAETNKKVDQIHDHLL
jgi:hypothetical protein